MEPAELARWTRFAAKGGIGKCTALQDCVAESPEQLMFMKDDEITVLMQLTDQEGWYLGYCEGVVGRFQGKHVQIHGKLKRPVMTKRSSSLAPRTPSSKSPTPTSRTLSPPDLETARFSFGSDLRPTSSQLSLAASSSSHHDIQTSEEDGPAPPSVSYSSSSTGHESSLDTPLDSPSQFTDRLVSKSPVEEPNDSLGVPAGAGVSADDEDKTPIQEQESEVPQAEVLHTLHAPFPRSTYSPTPQTPLSADPSIVESEPTRISLAISDDGETGIGLTLLQGMVNNSGDDGDDSSSMMSDDTRTLEQPHVETDGPSEPAPETAPRPRVDSDSKQSIAPSVSGSLYRQSRASSLHSHSDGAGEWEGASDIYDDYRYSRYSMASKFSRFSQASMYTMASDAPPVPREILESTQTTLPLNIKRPSMEAEAEAESVYSQQLSPAAPAATVEEQAEAPPTPRPDEPAKAEATETTSVDAPLDPAASRATRERPPPLQFTPSPLLHTTFGSPVSSPSRSSYPSGQSLLSPPLTTAMPSASQGSRVATALREKLERDRPSPSTSPQPEGPASPPGSPSVPKSSHGIVVEDEEGIPDSSSREAFDALPDTPSSASSYPDSSAAPEDQADDDGPKSPVVQPNPPEDSQPRVADGAIPKTQLATPDGGLQPRRRPPGQEPSQFIRESLFMPHPNAPRAPAFAPAGPMYGRAPMPPQQMPGGNLIHTLRMAASARYGPNGTVRRTTIYGMCKQDLSMSMGPVPIIFSLEPPQSIPANRLGDAIRRPSTTSSGPSQAQSPSPGPPAADLPPAVDRTSPAPPAPSPPDTQATDAPKSPSGNVIPRANFFPRTQTPRPRSRSFSGFDSPIAEITLPKVNSREERKKPEPVVQSKAVVSRTVSASAAVPVAAQQATISHQPAPVRRMTHGPSPLSLSSSKVPSSPTNESKSPTSPSFRKGSQVFTPSPLAGPAPEAGPSVRRSLRQVASAGNLRPKTPSSPLVTSPPLQPLSPQSDKVESESSIPPLPQNELHSLDAAVTVIQPAEPAKPNTSDVQSRTSLQGRRSGDTDGSHYSDTRSLMTSPPPGSTHRPSLKAKMSLPSLQTRSSKVTSPTPSTPVTEQETVQVKDMDFELVRPSIPALTSSRHSEDFMGAARDSSVLIHDGQSSLRPYSPAFSSTSVPRSPAASENGFPRMPSDSDNTSIEAHRQRELKWINLMSSTPPSQARKSKKIRKLLTEGVPASVRSNVWQHLTDSKSKRMSGLYAQLGKRGKVPASADIERDAKAFFPDKPQFQNPEGPLVYMLQAYLTMVPDIQYHPGLTLVAGQLLQQSIEEDAFWIFVSLMDTHLRPYFSSNSAQIEVDAALFSKALEANDAPLAKRLFGDMAIPPVALCRSWFCSLFAHALPPDTLHRVWDLFLFEGVVFLLRVGLAVASTCRKMVMEATKAEVAVNLLRNPPAQFFPPNPETFIALACGVKLKDDDVRKQRNKMEAQVKRQTQRPAQGGSGPQTASISLPRAPADK